MTVEEREKSESIQTQQEARRPARGWTPARTPVGDVPSGGDALFQKAAEEMGCLEEP